jgi:type VI secretion system protein VasG
LRRIEQRVQQAYEAPFSYTDEVVALIRERCTELESGGRMIDAILTNTVLPRISQEFLTRLRDEAAITGVRIAVEDGAFAYRFDG